MLEDITNVLLDDELVIVRNFLILTKHAYFFHTLLLSLWIFAFWCFKQKWTHTKSEEEEEAAASKDNETYTSKL